MTPRTPTDISFTFSAVSTPAMRPDSSWLSYWILGVLCCGGLGRFLWVGGAPPAFVAAIPRPLAVGAALGVWQSLLLVRWLKGGGDWWLPTLAGVLLSSFLAAHLLPDWTIAAWLPGAAAAGLVTGLGQWLVLRRTLRRSAGWILLCVGAKVAGALATSGGLLLADGPFASASPATRLVVAQGISLIGQTLTDGWLLGAVLGALLGPGNRRGPKLTFSA